MNNEFKTNWTISELLRFLRANPQGFKVYKGEKQLDANSDYIFIDLTGYSAIAFDDGGINKADLIINIYTQDFKKRQEVVKYINTRLFGSVMLRRDEEYYVATLERSLFLDETK